MIGKPARMIGASDYIMRAFAKAPQIFSPSPTTTRSSLYETRSLLRWTGNRSRSRPLSVRPTCRFSTASHLQQQVHGFTAANRQLSLQRWVIKEQISWQRVWQESCGRAACLSYTHTDRMLIRVWPCPKWHPKPSRSTSESALSWHNAFDCRVEVCCGARPSAGSAEEGRKGGAREHPSEC